MSTLADPIEIETNANGTVPAGALEIAVKNLGVSAAIVNGISIAPGEAWNYGFVGKPYRAMNYETNGNALRIRYTI